MTLVKTFPSQVPMGSWGGVFGQIQKRFRKSQIHPLQRGLPPVREIHRNPHHVSKMGLIKCMLRPPVPTEAPNQPLRSICVIAHNSGG